MRWWHYPTPLFCLFFFYSTTRISQSGDLMVKSIFSTFDVISCWIKNFYFSSDKSKTNKNHRWGKMMGMMSYLNVRHIKEGWALIQFRTIQKETKLLGIIVQNKLANHLSHRFVLNNGNKGLKICKVYTVILLFFVLHG